MNNVSTYRFGLALLLGLGMPLMAAPLDEALKPLPAVPVLDAAKVELGRQLFNEPRLSVNETLEQRVERRTQQLKDAQSERLDSARQAGMAEIATHVLHSVGNVLNSVNISADLVTRKLRSSKALWLGKVQY